MAAVSAIVVLRARSLVRLDRFLPVLLNNNRKQFIRNSSILRYCSTSDNAVTETKDLNDTTVSVKPQKKVEETKITLLFPDNSLIVTDLENANQIAKRRDLILIKVKEAQKKVRPVYKLLNQTEYLKQEIGDDKNEMQSQIKSIKTIQISSKINTHDLHIKLKNANKLLDKSHKVKIILANGSNIQDKLVKSIEAGVKNHGTLQKVERSTSTIFTITPTSNIHDNNNLGNVGENEKR